MGFYELPKEKRNKLVQTMKTEIEHGILTQKYAKFLQYASDGDTYIRKNAYLIVGRFYRDNEPSQELILKMLQDLINHVDVFVRQTVVNTLGEIGKFDAEAILDLLELAMDDELHKVRNAVMGSLKKMGEKNPKPTINFAKKFLDHPDPRIRREVIHGIELRGRTHPEDILPLLREVQHEQDKKVKETIIHVLGQISYKEGCLEKVLTNLKNWENQELVAQALNEILQVHKKYKFSKYSPEEVQKILSLNHL